MISVKKIVEKVRASQSTEDKGRHRGWIAAVISGLLVLIAVSILGFRAWLQSKRLAKLLHERDQAAEDARQAVLDAALVSEVAKDEEASRRAAAAVSRLKQLSSDRKELQRAHNETLNSIQDITSWDDVDKYLRN
jgi:uncharacterized membrane protein YcjF (UPF0283 family)